MKLPAPIEKIVRSLKKKRASAAVPSRDWLILLVLSLVVLAGSIAWNIWFFLDSVSEKREADRLEEEAVVDTSIVEQVRTMFDARSLEEVRYRGEYVFTDPSR